MQPLPLALLFALSQACVAADFYVSPSGLDSNSGSQASPKLTIGGALSASAGGDRIYLARGGTWRGTFTIGGNRELNAYGNGADPVVTSSVVVPMTGTWASNPSVRTGAVGSEALSVWVDGVFQPLARYPNSGYLSTATGTTLNQITGASLPARSAGRWTGAQVRWHRWHWFWETRPITTDGGAATLTLSSSAVTPTGTTPVGWETGLIGVPSGFFIDKDLDELDAAGEWFSSAALLYAYPPTGVDGGSMTVEAATTTDPIQVNGATIRNIAFRRFHASALVVNNPSTIEDCTFENIGDTAIAGTWNCAPLIVRRNVIRDIHNTGVSLTQNTATTGTIIERNLFHRIGVQRGYGGSGTWHHCGVLVNVGAVTVRLNRLVDIGYAGILLGNTPNNVVTQNVIVRATATSNDGGGIYTYKGPNTMSENIVLDSRGDQTAAEPFFPFGNGIWPEFLDGIANSQINDNTVAGCNGNGIALINNFTCSIQRNVLFDNLTSGLNLDIINGDTSAQGHTIANNTFATLAATKRLSVEGNLASWYTPQPSAGVVYQNGSAVDFGTMSQSTFVTGSGTQLARGDGGGNPVSSTLTALAAAQPAWVVNTGTTSTANAALLINDTEAAVDMPLPSGTWTMPDGTALSGTVTIQPFRSAVIVTSGGVPATPYTVASGIDWRASTPTALVLLPLPEISMVRGTKAVADGGSDTVTGTVLNTAKILTYSIANGGTAALAVSTPTISGLSNCTVAITTAPSTSIAPGGSSSLVLTVTPTSAAAWSFAVSMANGDSDEAPYDWTVSGTATATPQPEVVVMRNGTDIADGGGATVAGTTQLLSSPITCVVENQGSAVLTTASATVMGPVGCTATVTVVPSANLAVDATTSLVVTVTPSATSWSCTVQFSCNDTDEATFSWIMSGTATASAPEIALNRGGTAIADGGSDAAPGGTAGSGQTLTYTVVNAGTAALTLASPTFTTTSNCAIALTAAPAASVNAGETTSLSIQITPASTGAWSAAVTMVTSDGDENPTNWTIQGTATAGGSSGGSGGGGGGGGGGCGAGALASLLLAGLALLGLRRRR